MKAVVLCAGYGERLQHLTLVLPKSLMPVLGQPIVTNIIARLKTLNITEIGINTHHLADKISAYLGDGSKFGVKIHISYEPEILGTAGGVGTMRDFLKDAQPFIVYNSDIVTTIDIQPAIDYHLKHNPLATLILHDNPPFNQITLSPDNHILDIANYLHKNVGQTFRSAKSINKNVAETFRFRTIAFTGIAIMSPEILPFLPYKKYGSIIDVYLKLIQTQPGSIHGFAAKNHYWRDIGSIPNYLSAHEDILIKKIPVLQDKTVPENSVFIGKDTKVSEKTQLKGFVSIGKNCDIRAAILENCVIWDNITVPSGKIVKNQVIYQ